MTVAGMLPELHCDHDQLVCPLQNITCQCAVTAKPLAMAWFVGSKLIVQFDRFGQVVSNNANYNATAVVVEERLLSILSFPAKLQSGSVTLRCEDAYGQVNTSSYSIVGAFFENFILPNQSIKSTAYLPCNTEPPGPPVINMVMALNKFSASLFWTPPPYNCSLNYSLEVVDEQNVSVVFLGSTNLTTINVTTLNMGKNYSFIVASVDAAERMSSWSQPVSLAMQGLQLFCNHKIVNE